MTTHESFEEEAWESEIQALLGSLPGIDPPAGFISQSLDHRPLFAGRIGLGLVAVAAGVVGACVAAGTFGPREVVPELASMSQQHEMSVSSLFGGLSTDTLPVFEAVAGPGSAPPVTMPKSWREAGAFEAADLSHVLYTEGDDTASVFVERGVVAWDELGHSGQTAIGGFPAWVDAEHQIVVLQTADAVVTVVGLTPEEVVALLDDVSNEEHGFWDTVADVADGLTSSVGFPES